MKREESSSNNYSTYNKAIDQQYIEEPKQIIKSSKFSEQGGEQQQIQQHQQIVPILKEEYSISKETTIKEAKIEKRLVTKTKTVKVPTTHEELYINGKK